MLVLLNFPLLVVPLVLYNLVAFTPILSEDFAWDTPVIELPMPSGVVWVMTLGDMFLAFALLLLFAEVLKATRTSTSSVVDHMLSTVVLVLALVEFLIVPQAGTSVFFLLTFLILIDVVAGFSVTIRAARRDFAFGSGKDV